MSKTKWFIILGVWVGMIAFVGAVVAQDTAAAGCTAESLTALVAEIQTANGDALTAIESGDLTAAVEILAQSDEQVGLMKAVCSGLLFEGTDGEVIGPIDIPEGLYRATATTEEGIIIQIVTLDGECGQGSGSRLSEALFIESGGQANEGAETVFTSNNCNVLLEVSNVRAPWTLTFEKIA